MIKAYVLSNCQRCEELKRFLRKNSIAFQELNVEENPRALAKMEFNGIDMYPTIEINGILYSDEVERLKKIISDRRR